jgi:hypothetical protein
MTCIVLVWTPSGFLSTLFDASLLSTSKAAGNGGSFLLAFLPPYLLRKHTVSKRVQISALAGNHIPACCWTLVRRRAMIYSS